MPKERAPIPPEVAAAILVASAHTCCKCEERGAPIQIHHIDDNPGNNDPANLAVLCLRCHDETQIRGDFARHLSAESVRLYRDKWIARVEQRRREADALFVARAAGQAATRTDKRTGMKATESGTKPPQPSKDELQRYINDLPDFLAATYDRARAGWAGNNAQMRQATYEVNEVLQEMWLFLAAAYPDKHFGGMPAKDFIEDYVQQRYAWHYALATGPRPGPHGTIVGLLTAGGVLSDLQDSIVDTVKSIKGLGESRQSLAEWLGRWEASQKKG